MPGLSYTVSAILLVVAAVLLAIYRHKTLYHFKVVDPGRLYRSGTLGTVGLKWIRWKYRIRTIVNLRSEKEHLEGDWFERQKRFCRRNGVSLVTIPMQFDTPPEEAQTEAFLAVAMDPANLPVLVHCEAGIIRTNMMVTVYLKRRFGLSNEKILTDLPWFGHSIDKPKRQPVKQFILTYPAGQPRHSRNPSDPPPQGSATVTADGPKPASGRR